MRILFAGTPQTAIPSLTALAEHHDVVGVLTRAPAPVGRKRILTPSPVQLAAENLGIPVYTPQSLHDTGIEQTIRELAPEAVAVVAYG
ncbi:MAG: methionyl-tRNA formyltransferase, partial [Actinomycetaceae bacterium]|nr:methionyl-tRNA formyltransferase [Actinomycetaceae bacterium]